MTKLMEILVNENADNYMDFYGIPRERSEFIKQKMIELFSEQAMFTTKDRKEFLNAFMEFAIPKKPIIEMLKVKLLRNCESVNELIWAANFFDNVQEKYTNATRQVLEEVLSELQ